MADDKMDLHKALANLSPMDEDLLAEQPLEPFLESTFSNAAYIIDTLPIPPPSTSTQKAGRSRSGTVSSIASDSSSSSSKLTILPSALRPPPPPNPSVYTKDWKEVNPGGSNPHDIKVYKLSAKDGNGAWFARRSVHEGIGFARFRKGLRREFEESLSRKMGTKRSDVGNGDTGEWEGMVIPNGVRGIGAERRLDRKVAKGLGRIDVYHLSAQFPGPSAPRDFVTACITSSAAAPARTSAATPSGLKGREFTMVSRPLTHNEAPEQGGFVRGRYESIEFIREVIPEDDDLTSPRRSMSVSDLTQRGSFLATVDGDKKTGRPRSRTVGETPRKVVSFDEGQPSFNRSNTTAIGAETLREHKSSRLREEILADDLPDDDTAAPNTTGSHLQEPRRTDGDADSFENEEEGEANPVEWIMLTRSDPGGSVPRFMVERGTPGSIVKDAEKFLDWACEKIHFEDISDDEDETIHLGNDDGTGANVSSDALSSIDTAGDSPEATDLRRAMSNDDSTSNLSFRTASSGEGDFEEESSSLGSSQTNGMTNSGIIPSISVSDDSIGRPRSESSLAMQRVQADAIKAAERVKTNREKDDKKLARELAKEAEKQRKLGEKHAREAARREEKFKREQEKAEEKRRREEEKIRERTRRLEERDEKLRNEREKEDLRREIALLRKEKDVLSKENESLRSEVAVFRTRYELENGRAKTPPSRSSSQVALNLPQRSQSPASSSSSRGKKTPPSRSSSQVALNLPQRSQSPASSSSSRGKKT